MINGTTAVRLNTIVCLYNDFWWYTVIMPICCMCLYGYYAYTLGVLL